VDDHRYRNSSNGQTVTVTNSFPRSEYFVTGHDHDPVRSFARETRNLYELASTDATQFDTCQKSQIKAV
jgi:hypothetical protein